MKGSLKKTILVFASVALFQACAAKDRGDGTEVGTGSEPVLQTAISDVQQMEATADDIIADGTPLLPLLNPEADCTGTDCENMANSCSIFNRSSAIISSFLYKKDAYIELGLDLTNLATKLDQITQFQFSDGKTIDAVMNDESDKAIMESICSMSVYANIPDLLSRMAAAEATVDNMNVILAGLVSSGVPGPQGIQGPQGIAGPAGPQGPAGAAGPAGPQGPVGPAGPQGLRGLQGIQGPVGATGATGPAGATGPRGFDGADGTNGIDGIDGASACVTTGVCTLAGSDQCCTSTGIASGVWFRTGTKVDDGPCLLDAGQTPPTAYICGFVFTPGS